MGGLGLVRTNDVGFAILGHIRLDAEVGQVLEVLPDPTPIGDRRLGRLREAGSHDIGDPRLTKVVKDRLRHHPLIGAEHYAVQQEALPK